MRATMFIFTTISAIIFILCVCPVYVAVHRLQGRLKSTKVQIYFIQLSSIIVLIIPEGVSPLRSGIKALSVSKSQAGFS